MVVKVPFVGGSYSGRSTNINSQRAVNLFVAIDKDDAKEVIALYGTPGLKPFCALEAQGADTCIRGLHEMGSLLYAIIGNRVYSVTSAGVAILLGTISTSTGNVFMADNGTQMIIVDGSATGYYVQAGVLAAIADLDFPVASATAHQDTYIIVTEKDTGKFYISGLNDVTTWSALDFSTSEGDPDYTMRVISSNRELWMFGEKTTEVFWNSGNADFPFERIQGSMIEVGIGAAASAIKINGILYWLSDTRRIVRNAGYQIQIVSPPTIDHQIAGYGTVSDARAYTYTMEGHVFYVLIFPTEKKTWVYDITTNYWHEWESYNNEILTPWSRHRSNCGIRFGDKEIVGDYENGRLYELDINTYTDNAEQIRRIRAAQFISKDRVNVIYHSFEIEFEAGVGLTGAVQGEDPQAMLDWSDDGGHTWSNEHWVSIGKIGEYQNRAIWRRLGKARSRVFRVTVSDPVKVVMLGAYADLESLSS